jgi:peptide/nickel transport system permease protein
MAGLDDIALAGGGGSGTGPVSLSPVEQSSSLLRLAYRRVRRSKVATLSLLVIVLFILVAVFAPVLTAIEGQDPYTLHNDPDIISRGSADFSSVVNLPFPQYRVPSSEHWLGIAPRDGRDIFARLVYGSRVSLLIALLATALSVVMGVVLGAVAGYVGGVIDTVISRVMDLLLAFPQLLLALTLAPILQMRLGHTFLG